MMNKKKKPRTDKKIFFLLGIYLALLIFIVFTNKYIFFDEAVYIGMSKYIYSLGSSGLFELIRPLVVPIVIGLPLIFGISNWYFAKIIMVSLSVANVFLVFLLAKKAFNRQVAYLSVIIMMITATYLIISTKILTHMPAMFFMLFALWLFFEKKYFSAGLFAGLAFVSRFPYGLLLPCIIAVLVLSADKPFGKSLKKIISGSAKAFLGFAVPSILFIGFSLIKNFNEPIGFFVKLLRPFLLAVQTINDSNSIYGKGFFWYFTSFFNENFLLAFGIIGLLFLLYKYRLRETKTNILIVVFIVFATYFSLTTHKEIRYGLAFLPYMAIFAGVGIYWLAGFARFMAPKTARKKLSVVMAAAGIVCLLIIFPFGTAFNPVKIVSEKNELEKVFSYTEKPITSSSPLAALYTNNKIISEYYSLEVLLKEFNSRKDSDLLVINPLLWSCSSKDYRCISTSNFATLNIFREYTPVFFGKINNEDLIVVSRNSSFPGLSSEKLQELYTEHASVFSISQFPAGSKGIVVFRIDTVGDADENNDLINRENISKIFDVFINKSIPLSLAAIPKSFDGLSQKDKNILVEYYKKNKDLIEIAQNGYAFKQSDYSEEASEFEGLPLERQEKLIEKGKLILENSFEADIKTFVPPFNNADETTLDALAKLNFKAYSSGSWEKISSNPSIRMIPANMYFVKDWSTGELKNSQDLIEEYKGLSIISPYIVFQFSTNGLKEKNINDLEGFISYLHNEGANFMELSQLADWKRFVDSIDIKYNSSNIIIKKPEKADNSKNSIGLRVSSSGNYTAVSDFANIRIINTAPFGIKFCLNSVCREIPQNSEALFNISQSSS